MGRYHPRGPPQRRHDNRWRPSFKSHKLKNNVTHLHFHTSHTSRRHDVNLYFHHGGRRNSHHFRMNSMRPQLVTYHDLHPSDHMYRRIANMITSDNIVIDRIVEVDNPFLKAAYRFKRDEKRRQFGHAVEEFLLFHGTRRENVDSICVTNFDWRLYGTNRGHKYGKGVSFSRNANYASNYSDPHGYVKVMIVAQVLITRICQGHEDMAYPPPGFDAAQKGDNGIVIVKFDDNEFYPAYKLYYHFGFKNEGDYSNRYRYERPNYFWNDFRY